MVVPSYLRISLLCAVGSLLALTACSNSPTGRTLQDSLAADPRLTAPPTPVAPPQPSPVVAQSPDPGSSTRPAPQPGAPDFIGPALPSAPTPSGSTATETGAQRFTDLDSAPAELRQPLKDLAALGLLTEAGGTKEKASANLFEPNKPVTRRQYARWLFAANNRLQAARPAQQIRAGVAGAQLAFQDIAPTDPDFAAIQGLAEAGIIPSPLSGNSTLVTFRPDAPLTRETLLLWKVPLDTRQGLANANLDAVKQTWGFQDAGRIDPQALRAVLADFQNGDQANIRRVFGYTTLFQPKKAVTRAEAAATLAYFGTASDGISAAEVLKQGSTPASPSVTAQ